MNRTLLIVSTSFNLNDLPPSDYFTWEHTVEHFTCFAERYIKVQGDLLGVYTANDELQQEQQEIELINACTYRLLYAPGPCFLHSEMACDPLL